MSEPSEELLALGAQKNVVALLGWQSHPVLLEDQRTAEELVEEGLAGRL
jgi:hypothetical protein